MINYEEENVKITYDKNTITVYYVNVVAGTGNCILNVLHSIGETIRTRGYIDTKGIMACLRVLKRFAELIGIDYVIDQHKNSYNLKYGKTSLGSADDLEAIKKILWRNIDHAKQVILVEQEIINIYSNAIPKCGAQEPIPNDYRIELSGDRYILWYKKEKIREARDMDELRDWLKDNIVHHTKLIDKCQEIIKRDKDALISFNHIHIPKIKICGNCEYMNSNKCTAPLPIVYTNHPTVFGNMDASNCKFWEEKK